MDDSIDPQPNIDPWGKIISMSIIASAVLCLILVIVLTSIHPRTDDATVFANFIGIAPVVEGPVVHLAVQDNQFVHKGDLLYEIDELPYRYALQQALSEQAALEGNIRDQTRQIAGQRSAVVAQRSAQNASEAAMHRATTLIDEATADVGHAEAAVKQAQAEYDYAESNLKRTEPLLARKFVTADQVDQLRSNTKARAEQLRQTQAQLVLKQASLKAALEGQTQSLAEVGQNEAQVEQRGHEVRILDPLTTQREGRLAAVEHARYNLDRCRVYAPFDARVTNLTIAEGAYAHIGDQLFTLIDARTWWTVANFREDQLVHIHPGDHARVFIMQVPGAEFDGIVDSIGFGVIPDPDVVGVIKPGLPAPDRTLNWVHLATRYPVRVRILNAPAEVLRVGATSLVAIQGDSHR
jgi:membrane fusion protein, multidrug efflux system